MRGGNKKTVLVGWDGMEGEVMWLFQIAKELLKYQAGPLFREISKPTLFFNENIRILAPCKDERFFNTMTARHQE